MKTPRRRFVQSATAAVSAALCGVVVVPQVPKHGMPTPPPPAEPEQGQPDNSTGKISKRAILQRHEKEFRNSLTALSERVHELKHEVEQLHSTDIFSVRIYKQTSEIEHLAKRLKTLAKS
jgi:hypothetical protein